MYVYNWESSIGNKYMFFSHSPWGIEVGQTMIAFTIPKDTKVFLYVHPSGDSKLTTFDSKLGKLVHIVGERRWVFSSNANHPQIINEPIIS